MKLLGFIFLFLSIIAAFIYFLKKMGINVDAHLATIFSALGGTQYNLPTQNNQQVFPFLNHQSQSSYKENKTDYEHFATRLCECLKRVGHSCGLDCPNYADRLYCASLEDRVKLVNGYTHFLYEVPIEIRATIQNGALSARHIDTHLIEEKLGQNLPGYLDDLFYYSGPIRVWEISQNLVRIEVAGVTPNYASPSY